MMRERQIKERREERDAQGWRDEMDAQNERRDNEAETQRERGTREGWRKTKRTKCSGEKEKDGREEGGGRGRER